MTDMSRAPYHVYMDPNTTLQEIRDLLQLAANASNADDSLSYAEQLGEKFDNLDGWLSRGGFLPTDWAQGRWAGPGLQPPEDAYTYAVGTTWKQENGGGTDVDTSFRDRAECEARVAYWQRAGGPSGASMAADVYLVRKLKSDWEQVS